MQRLLAEVRKKTLEKRYRDDNGLEFGRFKLVVKVKGAAAGALSVPKTFIGKEASLTRDFMFPWKVKKGDLLVLDPKESAKILRKRGPRVDLECTRAGVVEKRSGDVDSDGYAEDILANCFVSAVYQPQRGARLLSLRGCAGEDRFAQPLDYIMAGKYILLGGAEELIVEGGSPGEIWKSEFERTEPEPATGSAELRFSRSLKSPEGVTISKEVELESDLPGVVGRYVISYAGETERKDAKKDGDEASGDGSAGKAGDKKEKDETDVTFVVRMSTRADGHPASLSVFDVPGGRGLTKVRYHRPGYGRRWRWRDWRDEHFGLKPGFVISRHEREGRVLAILFGTRRGCHLSIRSDYQGPELQLRHAPRKIPKGGRALYGVAFLVGSDVAANDTTMFLASKGRAGRGGIPVALTVRTSRKGDPFRVSIRTAQGRRSVTLSARDLAGAGRVHTKTINIPRGSFPIECTTTVGGERLSVRVEA